MDASRIDWDNEEWVLAGDAGMTWFGRVVEGPHEDEPLDGGLTLSPVYEVTMLPQIRTTPEEVSHVAGFVRQLVMPRGILGPEARFTIAPSVVSYASAWGDADRKSFEQLRSDAEGDRMAQRARSSGLALAKG